MADQKPANDDSVEALKFLAEGGDASSTDGGDPSEASAEFNELQEAEKELGDDPATTAALHDPSQKVGAGTSNKFLAPMLVFVGALLILMGMVVIVLTSVGNARHAGGLGSLGKIGGYAAVPMGLVLLLSSFYFFRQSRRN